MGRCLIITVRNGSRSKYHLKIEQRLTMNQYLTNIKETLPEIYNPYLTDPAALTALRTRLARAKDGLKKVNFLYSSIRTTTTFFQGNLEFSMNLIHGQYFKYEEQGMLPLGIKRNSTFILLPTFTYRLPSFEDRIYISYSHFNNLVWPGFDYRGQIQLGYNMGEYTTFYFDVNFASGERHGGYGRYEDYDVFRLSIVHHF